MGKQEEGCMGMSRASRMRGRWWACGTCGMRMDGRLACVRWVEDACALGQFRGHLHCLSPGGDAELRELLGRAREWVARASMRQRARESAPGTRASGLERPNVVRAIRGVG